MPCPHFGAQKPNRSRKAAVQSNASKPTKAVSKKVPMTQHAADAEEMVGIATIHVTEGSAEKVRKSIKAAKIPVIILEK